MPPKKRIKKENENKEKVVTNKSNARKEVKKSVKRVGRPRKRLSSDSDINSLTNGSNAKRKRLSNRTQFTHKEKKAFYECLVDNGFSAVHNQQLLSKTFPNRSWIEIKSMIESYSRRGQEFNRRNDESVDCKTNSDKQPIEKWFDLIHQTVPNLSKKDDISVIFAQIFDELAKVCHQKSSSRAGSSKLRPNYSQIYHYISETLCGKFAPELEAIDAFVVLKLIEELKELFKIDDYETEREFLSSGVWWQRKDLKSDEYYSAIHLQRQQESQDSVVTNVDEEKLNESESQMSESNTTEEPSTGCSSRTRSSLSNISKVKKEIEENAEIVLSNMGESDRQNADSLLNYPKLKKITDCLNPIQVPIEISKNVFKRWQE